MRRNAYVGKLIAAKAVLTQQQKAALIHRILTTVYQASAIALNEQFGFGAERIARFRDSMEAVIMEYGGLMDEADADYADGKLAQRYEAIMGADAYPERK